MRNFSSSRPAARRIKADIRLESCQSGLEFCGHLRYWASAERLQSERLYVGGYGTGGIGQCLADQRRAFVTQNEDAFAGLHRHAGSYRGLGAGLHIVERVIPGFTHSLTFLLDCEKLDGIFIFNE